MKSTTSQEALVRAKKRVRPPVPLERILAKRRGELLPGEMPDLSPQGRMLLMGIATHPFLNTSSYYELCGFNYRVGNLLKRELLKEGLIIEHEFHSGRKGGREILLEPTQKGYQVLKVHPPKGFGKGGYLHQCILKRAEEAKTRQGYTVFTEKYIDGVAQTDLVLETQGGRRVAVEIATTGGGHQIDSILNDFLAGYDRVIVIAKDKEVLKSLREKAKRDLRYELFHRVTFCQLAEFEQMEHE
jgi:predicted transcriptional regulator